MSVDNPFTHAIIPYGYGIGSESGENDSQMKRLFIIMFLLVLVVLAVFQATKIAEANKKLDRVLSSNKKLEIYMNQQMWLYDAALTANPDDSLLDPALTWLKVLQERRRKSLPAEGTSVSIVQIPEILLKEHQVFSWLIYVPEDKAVELYAFSGPEEPSSEITEASGFRHQLPAGSSSISLQLRGRSRHRVKHPAPGQAAGPVVDWPTLVAVNDLAVPTRYEIVPFADAPILARVEQPRAMVVL